MSRRYRIEVTAPASSSSSNASATTGSGAPVAFGGSAPPSNPLPPAFQQFFPLDVAPDGKTVNTAYLDVEFDLNSNSSSTMNQGSQMVTIRGVTPQMVAQVNSLNNMQIAVYGGFAKGMPLATGMAALGFNPLVKGTIFGAFGNWVGTDIYICLPIIPTNGVGILDSSGNLQVPNLTINGKKGEQWQAVITRSIQQAMPNVTYVVDVRPELVLAEDHQGTAYSLDMLGQVWAEESKRILGSDPNYMGVWVNWRSGVLYVTDNPNVVGSKQVTIKAEQLMGNPVWTQPYTLQLISPMRSDIYINDSVIVPQEALALAQSNPVQGQFSAANTATVASLAGTYLVTGIRHIGRARSPEALEWATVFDLVYLTSSESSTASASATTGSGAPVAFGS